MVGFVNGSLSDTAATAIKISTSNKLTGSYSKFKRLESTSISHTVVECALPEFYVSPSDKKL